MEDWIGVAAWDSPAFFLCAAAVQAGEDGDRHGEQSGLQVPRRSGVQYPGGAGVPRKLRPGVPEDSGGLVQKPHDRRGQALQQQPPAPRRRSRSPAGGEARRAVAAGAERRTTLRFDGCNLSTAVYSFERICNFLC